MRRTGGPHPPPPPEDESFGDETVPIQQPGQPSKVDEKFGTYATMFFFGCVGLVMFSCTVLAVVKIWKAIIP